VTELNSAFDDAMPNVSKDGREIVFTSNRPGGEGLFDIWSSTRNSVFEPWSSPVNLGTAINTAAPETRPSLSWGGERLYFGRAGDIYVSQRSKR
jgi:peptidoglycan-associated lipoprotein